MKTQALELYIVTVYKPEAVVEAALVPSTVVAAAVVPPTFIPCCNNRSNNNHNNNCNANIILCENSFSGITHCKSIHT